jgi:hypothetical protein
MAALGKYAYTKYTQRHGPQLSFASTAVGSGDHATASAVPVDKPADPINEKDLEELKQSLTTTKEIHAAEEELLSEVVAQDTLSNPAPDLQPIAVFPQYIANTQTTLIMRETSIPRFSGSFTVFDSAKPDVPVFHVLRKLPVLAHTQEVVDAHTNVHLMNVIHDIGTLPKRFRFDDPTGARVLELQGEFYVPFSGAKSTAIFKNAAGGKHEGAENVTLAMHGSYRNTAAEIKEKGTDVQIATVR